MQAEPISKRVLIVEDDVLIALHLEDVLSDLGHCVCYHATCVDQAILFANESEMEFAILDVNLSGKRSFPVAEVLRRRKIPFLFASGYGTEGFPAEYSNGPTLQKPYSSKEMERAIEALLSA